MKTHSFRTIVIALLLIVTGLHSSLGAKQKIACVDLNFVFENYFKTDLVAKHIEQLNTEIQNELAPLLETYEQIEAERATLVEASLDMSLGTATRREKATAAQQKLAEVRAQKKSIEEFDQSRNSQLKQTAQRMHNNIINDLLQAISDYAAETDIDLVIDSSRQRPNGLGLILHVDAGTDITSAIIDKLNKGKAPSAEEVLLRLPRPRE